MKLKNTYKYHLLLSIIIILMDSLSEYVTNINGTSTTDFKLKILLKTTFYITFFTVYSINFCFVCPKTLKRKTLIYFGLAQASLFFIYPAIRFFLEEIFLFSITGQHNYYEATRTFWYYIFDNSYFSLKAILFSTFMYLLFMFIRNNNKIHKLQLEHKKAELGALKTQLEPHFLFNTLNVFYSELAESKPETAKGIYKLSKLLRYLTYDAQKDYMPLHKEIKFIKDYIYFYEKRFEDNLFLELNINGAEESKEIPSLILIHFIENICKHGIINDRENPAKISININNDSLELTTINKIAIVTNYSSNGIGRENLLKRLDLLFKNNFNYNHKEENNIYTTYLKIPLKNSL